VREPATYRIATRLFLRLLGLTYVIAFASLWLQVRGLIGERGILPVGEYLARATTVLGPGPERFWRLPTLLWVRSDDLALHLTCALGVVACVLLSFGVAQRAALAAAWLLYLSLVTAGQDFLAFQWDNLLLEAGLIAVLLASAGRAPGSGPWHARLPVWLLHWLVFRLNFSSGFVKLASGDPTWRDLTALRYHYETQPLPTWTSWYAHQLPGWFQSLSVVGMFAVELVVPFLIFGPRRLRRAAAGALVALQLMIGLTGNYTFFNLLTVASCLTLLDDGCWPRWLSARMNSSSEKGQFGQRGERGGSGLRGARRYVLGVPATVLLILSVLQMTVTLGWARALPAAVLQPLRWAQPLRSVNGYGLFAVMTTTRPEIVVEGSRDGRTWVPYRFRWKPGPLEERPRFVQPHQPRLDWQMWFAALGGPGRTPWFEAFLDRLLAGEPAVLGLLAENPFPEGAPRFVRAELWRYRFTDRSTLRGTGRWWRRERLGVYAAPRSAQDSS
jgi:hypothetical protein